MLAQIAGEPLLVICNCALPPQLFILLLKQVKLLVQKSDYCKVHAGFQLFSVPSNHLTGKVNSTLHFAFHFLFPSVGGV